MWLAIGMLTGALLGVAGTSTGQGWSWACAAFAGVLLLWPVGWMATWRIVGPVRRVAAVAGELRGGRLDARDALADAVGDDEVGEVAGALHGMADRLARQLADQRALMAAVSHELRSPLARARVLVEMAREGTVPDGLEDALEAEIEAMDGIVGDLLAASRIDFEAVQPTALDPVETATRALDMAKLDRSLLVVEGDPDHVRADPTLVARALAVLLDNGRAHGGRVVAFRVRGGDAAVSWEVDDDGPGFAEGDEERAFEPFWRADGARPPGHGLGLALVRRIADAHGGSADAANLAGGGARVRLVVPAGS